ncbi:hypothetical protein GIB67_001011 [Kingdonia uniflora]|uniref:Cytochrome P450 n=1 Tax=Kingdonia uniflora TaxID=39325 RepID=A0A7J7MGD0_9MAGN|nr:hypothetical protein GIB67_001011 [Kingdonia uniflora]
MVFQFPYIFFTFLLLLCTTVIVKRRGKKTRLPPGPSKLPIIGSLHHLLGEGLPHHMFRDLAKKHGPLMHLQLGEISTIVISSSEMAKEVMKTQDAKFADRPMTMAAKLATYNYRSVVFAPYGNYWKQLRKICALELFSVKRINLLRSQREEEVSKFIKSISSSTTGAVNLSEKIYSLLNDMIFRAAFGKKCKDKHAYLSSIQEALKFVGTPDVADLFPSAKIFERISGAKAKLEKIHYKQDCILNDVIKEHKESKKDTNNGEFEEDFVDVLLRLQESDDLELQITNDDIKAVILDIFVAGSETSSTVIEWAMSELMRSPGTMEKVQAEVRRVFYGKQIDETHIHELHYMKLVIKEILRLHPPVPFLLPRNCREKCEINGYEIPVKSNVIVNEWAIGRDPVRWRDAESFVPERFNDDLIDFKGTNFDFIPFGAGRRICPGISLGLSTIELPLAQLLYYFDWKLPDGIKPEELDMTESFETSMRRKNALYLVPTLYNHVMI